MADNLSPDPSSILALLSHPQLLTGFLHEFLTAHFQERQIEQRELLRLIWQEADRTGILIETNTAWVPNKTGARPAVIIKRNEYANFQIGIGDRVQPNPASGVERFETFWTGSHTLFCIGGTGAQAEFLATEVQRHLTRNGNKIREQLQLLKFRVLSVGPVHELEEARENFVVPVTAGYSFGERYEVVPNAPRLSKITLSLSGLLNI